MLLLGSICTSVAPAAALGQRQEALRPSGFYLFLWQSRRIKIGGTLFLLWDRSRQLFLSSLSADQMLRGAATPWLCNVPGGGCIWKKQAGFNDTEDQTTLESVTQEWRSQGRSSAQTRPQTAPLGINGQVISRVRAYAMSFKGKYTPVCPRDIAQ